MPERQTLLFYCQHALGLGHLVRSLTLASALAEQFEVVLLNGGRFPDGTTVSTGVRVVNLPPLGHDPSYNLISHDPAWSVEAAMRERPRMILHELAITQPAVVLIELFPFGRKKFEFELLPLLDAVHSMELERPRVVCGVRDILVGTRRDQARHDERASTVANRYFDAILVHSDPQFARLDDTFRPAVTMTVPVHYTGFVTDSAEPIVSLRRIGCRECWCRPVAAWWAARCSGSRPLLTGAGTRSRASRPPCSPARSHRSRSGRGCRIRRLGSTASRPFATCPTCEPRWPARRSPSASVDTTRRWTSCAPACHGGEDEQRQRAERLDRLGVLRSVPADGLDAERLADAVIAAATSTPARVTLDLDGRDATARIIAELSNANLAGVGR